MLYIGRTPEFTKQHVYMKKSASNFAVAPRYHAQGWSCKVGAEGLGRELGTNGTFQSNKGALLPGGSAKTHWVLSDPQALELLVHPEHQWHP